MGDKIYVPYQEAESEFVEKRSRFIGHIWPVDSEDQAQELIRRVTRHLPYDTAGLLDGLYREAKVESVEYAASIDVVAVCPPKVLGQVKDYVEGWHEEKEDWEL